jgi:hypothetical protein
MLSPGPLHTDCYTKPQTTLSGPAEDASDGLGAGGQGGTAQQHRGLAFSQRKVLGILQETCPIRCA